MAALVTALLAPCYARAQQDGTVVEPDAPVRGRYVGVAGGAILGAELVVAAEALFGVNKKWAYLTFPLLGAGGGGVGGYFLEQESTKGSIALLVGGMALIIPAAIAATVAVTYDPEDEPGALMEPATEGPGFPVDMEAEPTQTQGGPTTTEVEARPPILPEQSTPPSGTETESKPETNSAPEPNKESPQPSGQGPKSEPDNARGGDLGMRGDGAFVQTRVVSISAPTVDLRPSRLSEEEAVLGLKPALEIYIRLLRVDFL